MNSSAKLIDQVFAKPVIIACKFFLVLPFTSKPSFPYIRLTLSVVVLLINCLHLYFLPVTILHIENELGNSEESVPSNHVVKILYSFTVYLVSLISRLNCLFRIRKRLIEYAERMSVIDGLISFPKSEDAIHWKFSFAVTVMLLLIHLPINLIRLRMFYNVSNSYDTVLLFANMYFQNLSTMFAEVQFSLLVFSLYLRFKVVNRNLRDSLNISDERFRQRCRRPFASKTSDRQMSPVVENPADTSKRAKDHLPSVVAAENLISVRVLFKVYKQLFAAIKCVQNSYGLQLLISSCALWLMMLLDLYMEIFGFIGGNSARPSLATYIWCFQYITRFTLMAIVSQKLSNEGVKTKYMVSALNNRFLDSSTKEELTLFSNYISNTKIEFTACDFFTLNTHLITSAIAAGTTYLVILVQFHSDKD